MSSDFFLTYYLRVASDFLLRYQEIQKSKYIPLQNELKKFFQKNKKFGKRDRVFISECCYAYYRSKLIFEDLSIEDSVFAGIYLLNREWSENEMKFLKSQLPDLDLGLEIDFDKKIEYLQKEKDFRKVDLEQSSRFLTQDVETKKWLCSFFNESFFFVRIKEGKKEVVVNELSEQGILFFQTDFTNTLRLKTGTKVEQLECFERGEVEIQDLSSQRLIELYRPSKNETWWDACAASGGKSLLLLEKESGIKIFATDIRDSILENYDSRMKKVGYSNYSLAQLDLSQQAIPQIQFDGILLDVPCSGSGTWKRSPEAAIYFEEEKLNQYTSIQKRIIDHVIPSLKPGGQLIYSTCSVFESENERQSDYILQKHGLSLTDRQYFNDEKSHSDWLYGARFIKE